MTKYDYLTRLKHYLQPLPEKERVNVINYYDRYLTQAGPENEERAMRHLGTPRDLAHKIIANNRSTIPGIVNETKNNVKHTAGNMKNSNDQKSFATGALMLLFGGIVLIVLILLLAAFALFVAGALAVMLVFGFALFCMSVPYLFKYTSIGLLAMGLSLISMGIPVLIFMPSMNFVFFVIKKALTKVVGMLNGMLKGKAAAKN